MKKVFRATKKDQYVQPVELDPGRYTFHSTVKGEVYSFALKTENGVWLPFDLSWQLEDGEWSRITHVFDLTEKCVEFSIFASDTASEVLIGDPMLEEGNNRSTPSPHPADGFEQTRVSFDILDDKIVAEITGENGRLTKAEQTLDGIETTVYDPDTGESKITQLANEIETKVSKDGVISSINVSTEGIDISAERINFTGSVKFESAVRDEVQGDLDGLASDIQDAQQAVNDLDAYVDGAFKDGVINSAEAKAIEKYLNSLSETKLSVDSAYTQVYNNTYLTGTPKTNLATAKTALNTAYTNLVNSINTAIAGGATTPAEKADVDTKFGLFNTAMATYQVRLAEANKAIQDKLKSYSDDAMTKAEQADYLREALQQTTEIEGGLVLGSVIAARDAASVVRSYQNGDPELNNTAFASGVDNFGLSNETRKTELNHDGSGHLASGNIQWDAAGNTLHKGAVASPFQRTISIYENTFSNNLIVTGNFGLPWDEKGSGRLIRLIQPKSGSVECIAPAFLDPNDKRYFYEDGAQKDKLVLIGQEIVELLGYTDSAGAFKGWLVLNRGLMHTVSTWGEPHRIIAQGHISESDQKYHTFDGSPLLLNIHSFTNPAYKTASISMNSSWFSSDNGYYVKIIGNNGNYSVFHTVSKQGIIDGYRRLQVAPYQLSGGNIISSNVINFYFEIYSAAWMYPKSGGGGTMPGEEW